MRNKIYCACLLAVFILSIQMANSQNDSWHNPFPKDELNKSYVTSYKQQDDTQKYLFKVKKNRIDVLFDWKGNEAPFGLLTTIKKYSSYNLELEYKWGKRKFKPRLDAKRDAGILFHINDKVAVWPKSLECQIQENDTGDLWVIRGPKVTAVNKDKLETVLNSAGEKKYLRSVKYDNHEKEGWNTVRVEVRANKWARFYVNGEIVNEIKNFYDENGNTLENGFIGIQAEGAELSYRNIRIQEVKD